ncbi:MAG: hypothetical protein R3F61_33025 [Myxococcota bacterium]
MLILALAAHAATPWSVTPEIGTEVPLRVGAGVRVEGPGRIRAGLSGGFVPKGYVALANDATTALFEGYTEEYATLVETALASSLIGRVDVGWRPHPRAGWWFAGGASLIGLGGEATAAELLEGLTGTELPRTAATPIVLTARATVVTLDVQTGWDIRVWRELVVRPLIGWSFTVSSHSRIEADTTELPPRLASAVHTLEDEAATELDAVIEAYVHPPTVGLSVGWVFR